jgi:hypothetical protein
MHFIIIHITRAGELSQYSNGLQSGWLGFDSQQRQKNFLHSTVSRLALKPTQPPIPYVPRALPLEIK